MTGSVVPTVDHTNVLGVKDRSPSPFSENYIKFTDIKISNNDIINRQHQQYPLPDAHNNEIL